jgi:ethanolamine ammonia-lyase small subunit
MAELNFYPIFYTLRARLLTGLSTGDAFLVNLRRELHVDDAGEGNSALRGIMLIPERPSHCLLDVCAAIWGRFLEEE